jgi:hypothetical protein
MILFWENTFWVSYSSDYGMFRRTFGYRKHVPPSLLHSQGTGRRVQELIIVESSISASQKRALLWVAAT